MKQQRWWPGVEAAVCATLGAIGLACPAQTPAEEPSPSPPETSSTTGAASGPECRTDEDCVFSWAEEIRSAEECRVQCCQGMVVSRAVADRYRASFQRWCADRVEELQTAAGCEQAICEMRGDAACVEGACSEVSPTP